MPIKSDKKYFFISALLHVFILMLLIAGFDFTKPLPVIENTNKNDVISAVVLGDSAKSKILPNKVHHKPKKVIAKQEESKPEPTPEPMASKPKPEFAPPIKKDLIALKVDNKKKMAEQNKLQEQMRKELLSKDLLAEINKKHQQQKAKQKQLQLQFAKILREQNEKTLRQQLLNEEIKLQGTQSRQSQGEVNKYKALILQAISEHWIIPAQANKKLYCELMIRVAPGGSVMDVQITKSSGDPSLDSSARAAVLKASPLPVPTNDTDFEAFRQFVLKVKPENILSATAD